MGRSAARGGRRDGVSSNEDGERKMEMGTCVMNYGFCCAARGVIECLALGGVGNGLL